MSKTGNWVKMCMQCGVCSGSCTFGPHWEHPPQELFMMIRAGKREEVLTSDSVWMCTSCYSCIVRCPRDIPITHIMHGLASYAHRLGLAPKMNPTRKFSKIFWDNLVKTGRVNEMQQTIRLYLMNGLIEGIKTGVFHEKHRTRNAAHEAYESDWNSWNWRLQGQERHSPYAGKSERD